LRATHKAGSEHTGEAGDGRVGPELERGRERKRAQADRETRGVSIYLSAAVDTHRWRCSFGCDPWSRLWSSIDPLKHPDTEKYIFGVHHIGIGFLSPGGGLIYLTNLDQFHAT
jgi:hypothetical protein